MNRVLAMTIAAVLPALTSGYPLDGYEATGIGRLEWARRVQAGEIAADKQPAGGTLTLDQVDLRLLDRRDFSLPEVDTDFTARVRAQLGEMADLYGIAVLDLSDPDRPRYAEHQADIARNPGSVGKLVVALAVFQMLADLYPDDMRKRIALLRDTVITADEFVNYDHHTVRMYDVAAGKLERHPLHPGDRGTLWEYLDWMTSASSNSAASAVLKELILMAHFRDRYPVGDEEGRRYMAETPRQELSAILMRVLQEPVTRNGLDLEYLRQGGFFTATGQKRVPATSSHATPRELMRYVILLEQGRLVDEWSSREIKRLLYSTERRIRYASSPVLAEAAVYFKSGSLVRCQPGHRCKAYEGDLENLMNSVCIVESPASGRRNYYVVTLMSNVLGRNSAVEHQALAGRLHKLIEGLHPAAP
jgi:hypothetical protein